MLAALKSSAHGFGHLSSDRVELTFFNRSFPRSKILIVQFNGLECRDGRLRLPYICARAAFRISDARSNII
jgi:hypothetical protein